jgi:hypothetical protein
MAYIRGEAREQTTMFPVTLDELIRAEHICRVIEAFVDRLDVARLGFVRAEPADSGRPGYDPRDLLKLYLYDGYLQRRLTRGPSTSRFWALTAAFHIPGAAPSSIGHWEHCPSQLCPARKPSVRWMTTF